MFMFSFQVLGDIALAQEMEKERDKMAVSLIFIFPETSVSKNVLKKV